MNHYPKSQATTLMVIKNDKEKKPGGSKYCAHVRSRRKRMFLPLTRQEEVRRRLVFLLTARCDKVKTDC